MALYTNSHAHAQEMTYPPHLVPHPPRQSVEYAILRHDAVVKTLPAEHCKPAGIYECTLASQTKSIVEVGISCVILQIRVYRSGPGSDPVAGGDSSLGELGKSCGYGHRESGENQETCTELEGVDNNTLCGPHSCCEWL